MVKHNLELGIPKNCSSFQTDMEAKVLSAAPWPISFDVDATQTPQFSEFSYTDTLGGIYINTQSVEINCRVIEAASKVHCEDFTLLDRLRESVEDKYDLEAPEVPNGDYSIGFMVGQNMFDLVSREIVGRLAHENDNFFLKLHPITAKKSAIPVASLIGWNKIIRSDVAAVPLLKAASEVYTTTASELTIVAVAMGKKPKNISNFFNESSGVYYPICRLLFRSEDPMQVLNNILNCKFSGLILPVSADPESMVDAYFEKALEMRSVYAPISTPSELRKAPIKED